MSDIKRELDFEVVHFGINCESDLQAKKEAELLSSIFGLELKDGKDSIYAGPLVEIMKNHGRGTCGHIAVAAKDINKAQKYLENLGLEFDNDSSKYDTDGNLIVRYLKNEIAGFAVHLLQR